MKNLRSACCRSYVKYSETFRAYYCDRCNFPCDVENIITKEVHYGNMVLPEKMERGAGSREGKRGQE